MSDAHILFLRVGGYAALPQAARYAQQLGLTDITLALFIDTPVDDANRAKYEAVYEEAATGVTVQPVLVEIVEP